MNLFLIHKGGRYEKYAPSFIYYAVFAVLLLLFSAGTTSAMEGHGLISLEDYYSSGGGPVYDKHFLTTRIRFDLTKLDDQGTLSFHFDGRQRENLGGRDYNTVIRNWRVDTFNLQYSGKRLYLAAGRLWPKDLPAERVDGVNAVYQIEAVGIGAFAGAKPDPYTEAYNSDYRAAGAYVTYRKDDLSGAVSFVHNEYRGGTDRQYVYGNITYLPVKEVFIYSTVTADINQNTKKPSLTNALIELNWRPDFKKSLTVGYNRFHAIRYYRSMAFGIDDSRQEAYYAGANYRLGERYGVYARLERQYRYATPTIPREYSTSTVYRAGLTADNIMDTEVNMNLSATVVNNYTSRNDSYTVELSRLYREVLQMMLAATYNKNTYEATNSSDTVYIMTVSGFWTINKRWNASLTLDHERGASYATSRVLTRISFKF